MPFAIPHSMIPYSESGTKLSREWKFVFRKLRDDSARINFHLNGVCESILEEVMRQEVLDSGVIRRLGGEW